MKRSLGAIGVVSALILAGCMSNPAKVSDASPAGSNRPVESSAVPAPAAPSVTAAAPTTSAPAPKPTPIPTPTPTEPGGVAKFGKTYTWTDGLSVTVSAPAPYTPSQYAAGVTKGVPNVVVGITIVNKTKAPFDPVLFHVTAQSGNEEAKKIFDTNVGTTPTTKVLPGREVTFKMAFSAPAPNDMVLEVTPSFDHDSVIYTS